MTSSKLYEKFIQNSGKVKIEEEKITVFLKKKRDLPLLLEKFSNSKEIPITDLEGRKIFFKGHSTTQI